MTDFLRDGERYRTLSDGTVLKIARDEDVMQDGQRMRVPLLMCDGAKPAPVLDAAHQRPRHGVIPMNDRVRLDASHAIMVKRTQDAWKKPVLPPAPAASPTPAPQAPIVSADAKAAYERRSKRLEDAWRGK